MKKLKEQLLRSITVFLMILGIFPGITVLAYAENEEPTGNNITDVVVTSFDVDPKKIENTSSVTVNLTFSEKDTQKIQPGDFIEVTWTYKPEEVYFVGFQVKTELSYNDIHMADLNVAEDKATIVFTDAVKDLYEISGSANFSLKGYNLKQIQEGESWDAATVRCGNLEQSIEIHTVTAGDPVFFGKTGTMYEEPDLLNQVFWWLRINDPRYEITQDIVVEDELQEGQAYGLLESVSVIGNAGSKQYYSYDEFKANYPDVEYTQTENKIRIVIPAGHATQTRFEFNYVTNITENLPYFGNKANVTGQYLDKNSGQPKDIHEEVTAEVKNISFGGDIIGTVKGELKIIKIADDGKETPVPGVKFILTSENGLIEGQQEKELVTNAQGIAGIKGLSPGRYTVKEISAPDWIEFDPTQAEAHEFVVTDSDIHGTELEITNKIKRISIPVEKIWVGKPGEKAEVILLANDQVAARKDLTEDIQWEYTFENLPMYDAATGEEIEYTLKETTVDGYKTVITGDAQKGFTVTNTITGKVSVGVAKQWVGPSKDSVTIHLLANGQKVKSQVLDAANDWKYTFTDLDKYENGEEIAYTVDEEEITGYDKEISGDMTNGFIVKNTNAEKISIPVEKQWVGKAGKKAEVILLANDQVAARKDLTEDIQWKYIFENFPKYDAVTGEEIKYTLKETAVDGYKTVITGDAQKGFTVVNTQIVNPPIPDTDTPSKPSEPDKSPKTGDSANIYLWLTLSISSFCMATVIGAATRKRPRDGKN